MATLADKLKQLIFSKKIGITYNVDPTQGIGKRGGKFLELTVLDSNSQFAKSISDVPLEAGKVINDNIKIMPKSINMKVLISDYSSGLVSSSLISSAINSITNARGEVATKLDLFKKIHEDGLVCDITLMTREYQNMQLMSYSFTEDPQNRGKYLTLDINFQEMMFFSIAKKNDNKKINALIDNGAGIRNNASIIAKL